MMYKNFGCKKPISCHHPSITDRIYVRRESSCRFQNLSLKCTQEPRLAIQCLKMGSRNRNSGAALWPFFLSFCCNAGKLPRLSGDSHFAFFYLLNSQTRPVQRTDLQPETKTEPQPRSHWPRFIVRARATDARSSRGAKDSEQKTQACSSIIVPEERKESRKRSKEEKREVSFSHHKPRLCRTQLYLQWCATARKRNRGYGQKGVPLSQLLASVWCRFQGGEAKSCSRSVREQKVDKKGNSSFPFPFLFSLRSVL